MAEKKLSKKALTSSYINWSFYHLCAFSFDRMQAFGFCQSMMPLIKELYPNDEKEQIKALQRHSVFYNTEPIIGAIVPGIIAAMEENRANGMSIDDGAINGLKAGLMGPLAGIGDSFFQGLLCPILLSLGISFAAGGSIMGPLFYVVTMLAFVVIFTYWAYFRGYKLGVDSIGLFLGEKAKAIQSALKVLGLLVIGGIAASFIGLQLAIEIPIEGGDVVSIQSFIDTIFPNFLALGVLVLFWYLIVKKRTKPTTLILGVLVVATAGVLLGIM